MEYRSGFLAGAEPNGQISATIAAYPFVTEFSSMTILRFAPAFGLALLLSACGGGPRPVFPNIPPPPMRGSEGKPPPVWQKASPPSHGAAIAPAPGGPLTVARIGGYMDGLETALRRHLRGILVARQGDNLTVVIPNTSLFASDGGVSGDDVLEPLAAALNAYPRTTVAVNGFTDTAGTPEQNLALSQKRAREIADALAHEGVAPQRLSSQGFGETHLRVATGDGKKEPRNRRIELVIRARPG